MFNVNFWVFKNWFNANDMFNTDANDLRLEIPAIVESSVDFSVLLDIFSVLLDIDLSLVKILVDFSADLGVSADRGSAIEGSADLGVSKTLSKILVSRTLVDFNKGKNKIGLKENKIDQSFKIKIDLRRQCLIIYNTWGLCFFTLGYLSISSNLRSLFKW